MSRNNGRARRDERYRSAVQRQLAFLAGHGAAVVTDGYARLSPTPVPWPYAPIEEFLRPGDTAARHTSPCESCAGSGYETRKPLPQVAGNAYGALGIARQKAEAPQPCPHCDGTAVAA